MINDFDELIGRHHANNAGFCRHYFTLYSIILGMEAKTVFEFGSGYSSKVILKAMKETGGYLISCDVNPVQMTSHSYSLDDKEMKESVRRWRYIQKRSYDAVRDLTNEVFDVVLHDGDHRWKVVASDLKAIIPRMKKNGILLVHDMEHPTDNYQLNKALDVLPYKFSSVVLPYGYGLAICRIEEDFGNGAVEIKWRKK